MSDWAAFMDEAIGLALVDDVFRSANPRVGCVIVDATGTIVGRGHHRGAGTAHAEIVALTHAGDRARGATAVVTLEPCRHRGRTGPCTQALVDAGIARVVYAVDDPGDESGQGAAVLRHAGVEVVHGVREAEAAHANRAWVHAQAFGRPLVTLKSAISLDGRVADASGGPTAISGAQSREYAHRLRSLVDAVVVGTGTVLTDDPQLTARHANGQLRDRQPLRVVVGSRAIPVTARIMDDAAPTVVVTSHDMTTLMNELMALDVQHALVEGGPGLAAALLNSGVVDEILWFIAPVLLGAGPVALAPLAQDQDVAVRSVRVLGEDVLVEGVIQRVHRDH